MGKKKTNKKKVGGKHSKPKHASDGMPQASGSGRRSETPGSGREDATERASLYTLYKYCTQQVIDWGRSVYVNLKSTQKRKPQKGKGAKNDGEDESLLLESITLSHLIFQCLGTVAKVGVPMPPLILQNLRTAISCRKRVANYYRSIPKVCQESLASHEWLILQLERLEGIFSKIAPERTTKTKDGGDVPVETGFSVLALSDNDEDSDDDDRKAPKSKSSVKVLTNSSEEIPPTDAALREEERFFAIALLLSQMADGREQLKGVWKSWAGKDEGRSQDDDAAHLLAATAATDYTLHAFQKLVWQANLEFGEDVFDQFLREEQDPKVLQTTQDGSKQVGVGDGVTIRNLQSRPDLNGKHGKVTQILTESEGRVAVELFPDHPKEYRDANRKKLGPLSVKCENLLLSDHLCVRLNQVNEALKSVPWDAIPEPPPLVYGDPTSTSVHNSALKLVADFLYLQAALEQRDFRGFLHLTVQSALPMWISMSRYLPDSGPINTALSAFLREFDQKRRIEFHLALAMIVVVDCALTVYEVGDASASDCLDIVRHALDRAFDEKTYTDAIGLFEKHHFKSDALYSHLEFTRHLGGEYLVTCSNVPLLSGELLLDELRAALVCSSGLPYSFVQECTCMLHMYWMLRTEGYLGEIPEIEATLVSMYRQKVWFRAGLPQRDREAYVKSWQLSLGAVNANSARLLDGRPTARKGRQAARPKDLEMTGLHVTEISRLRDILQWKTMPIADIAFCVDRIQRIARDEYHSIFTPPLMSSCVQLMQVYEILGSPQFVTTAEASGANMFSKFSVVTHQMKPAVKVCFWGLALGDNRSLVPSEKHTGLKMLADAFHSVFPNEASNAGHEEGEAVEPTLRFSSYTHDVDKSLWGEQGAQSQAHR